MKKASAKKQLKTGRLNLMIDPILKREIHAYAKRNFTSVSAIITGHFIELLKKEKEPNVEQI